MSVKQSVLSMSYFESCYMCCPSRMVTSISACSESYIAVPLNERGNIAIWNCHCPQEKPFILIGHHRIVSSLALSNHPASFYLCSCSSDNIILWDLSQNEGKPTKGKVLFSDVEQVLWCCFSSDNSKIFVSVINSFWLYSLKNNVWYNLIEDVCFNLFNFNKERNKLISIEENFLEFWDLSSKQRFTKTSISPGFPSTLSMHIQSGYIAVGTTCGHINIYGGYGHLIRSIQIWKVLAQFLKDDHNNDGIQRDLGSDNFPVYAVQLFSFEKEEDKELNLPDVIHLLVVTSTCLILLNINNEDVEFYLDFNNCHCNSGDDFNIGLIRSAAISNITENSTVYVNLIPIMGDSLVLFKFHLREIVNCEKYKVDAFADSSEITKDQKLSFLLSGRESNENSLLVHRVKNSSRSTVTKKPNSSKLFLPVTFHAKVKSSGYGTLNRTSLFQPRINKKPANKSQCILDMKNFQNLNISGKKSISEKFGSSFDPQKCVFLDEGDFIETPTLSSLQVTADGAFAICTSADGLIDIIKIDKKRLKNFSTVSCHKGTVNAAKWSHTGNLIITAGEDKTAKIWNLRNLKRNAVLVIGSDCEDSASMSKSKFHFEDAVQQAQFYYLDQFILAASGNKLHLFDYKINIEKSGIKDYINRSSLKLIKRIPLNTKRLKTIAAVNQFFSNLVLCAGSSNSIDAIDMTVGEVVWHANNISCRSPYLIAVNEGSPFTSQPQSMYDLFLTSSLSDGIKVWDLRIKKSIICYKEHKCQSLPCSAAFSTCGQYIASGSEDKSAYIYDLRQLTHVHKISDHHSDVVTSIAFLPTESQLITSTLNGVLSLFGEK